MSKVDQVDLEAVINMKSNKADTDVAMKGLDIVHKQVTHMIVLVVELIKSCMNSLSHIHHALLSCTARRPCSRAVGQLR